MIGENECPICGKTFESRFKKASQDDTWYWCDVCGRFRISHIALHTWLHSKTRFQSSLQLLQGSIRERTDRWDKQSATEEPDDPAFNQLEDIESFIEQAPQTVQEKADKLLAAAVRRSEWFGKKIEFHPRNDVPLAYAQNTDEFFALLTFLAASGLAERIESGSASDPFRTSVTAAGYQRDRMRAISNAESETAFVAMWFGGDMPVIYSDAIAPAIRRCGYRPKRVDLEEHNDDVVDRMLAMIRESRFVVADFSEHRNGVYFEAGFAAGLGIPVVWTCKKGQMGKAHFDTNHFSHVIWNDGPELADRLESRIIATIGRGPLKDKTQGSS